MAEGTGDARLDLALDGVVEALAALSPARFARLCEKEPAEVISMMQYFEFAGVPSAHPPEMLLGRLICERLDDRYPHVIARDAASIS